MDQFVVHDNKIMVVKTSPKYFCPGGRIFVDISLGANALFSVWRDSGVSLWDQISRLSEKPCWLYA